MFSSTAEYALRAVVHLAISGDARCSSQAIARSTKVPGGYLSKILKNLVDGGIVQSQRGPTGGFSLARDARSISVLDVINAVDPIKRITTCPLGIPSHGTNLCPLHRKLDESIAMVERALQSTPITEMVQPLKSASDCAFPQVHPVRVRASSRRPRRPNPKAE